jgi:rod shape-determining protein MreC
MKWDANAAHLSKLLYVPRHLNIAIGDTIVTSGFNSVFPDNMPLGKIEEIELTEDASFYNIVVRLFTEFKALQYVYVVGNRLKEEQENLESPLKREDDE